VSLELQVYQENQDHREQEVQSEIGDLQEMLERRERLDQVVFQDPLEIQDHQAETGQSDHQDLQEITG